MEIIKHKDKYYFKTKTGYREVLATTDTSLIINDWLKTKENNIQGEYESSNYLPQPSDQFIQKYIEEYNKGNIITDVDVLYESYCKHGNNCPSKGDYNKQHLCDVDYRLKVNMENNNVTIKKIKDNWNREEVELLCRDAYTTGYDTCMCHESNKGEDISEDNWIEKNL